MADAATKAPPLDGFGFEYRSNNEYTMTLRAGTDAVSATVPVTAATGMISLLMVELAHSQTPEAEKALQMFALRNITAKALEDGTPYLEYTLENGSRFATGIPLDGLRALYRALGEVLGKVR